MGDSDSIRFSDGEYIEGMTFTQHLNQMKLSAFITIAAVIGASFIAPNPAQAWWGGTIKKGSLSEAKEACQIWSTGQGFFTVQSQGTWDQKASSLVTRNKDGNFNVPVAFCYYEPESKKVLGEKYDVPKKYINNSKLSLDGAYKVSKRVVRRFSF